MLFAAMTLICVWLSWEVYCVRTRRWACDQIEARGGLVDGVGRPLRGFTAFYRDQLGTHRERWTFGADDGLIYVDASYNTSGLDRGPAGAPFIPEPWVTIQIPDPDRFAAYRVLLGDQPVRSIRWSRDTFDAGEQASVLRLFPEAEIEEYAGELRRADD